MENNMVEAVKGYLNQDREGAETFEYVLIVAILVTLIMVLFNIIGPVFRNKMNNIANNVNNTGNWITQTN